MIPRGLSLRFNLAHRPTDSHLQESIQSILNTASSRILDAIRKDVCKSVDSASYNFSNVRDYTEKKRRRYLVDYRVGLVKKECTKDLANLGRVHGKKLRELTPPLVSSTLDQSTPAIVSHFPGSLKISANGYTMESFSAKQKHRVRPHRRLNSKAKEKRKTDRHIPCPET